MNTNRSHILSGITYQIESGCGKMYITINENFEGKPIELIARMGKAGGCAASQVESIGKLISMSLRDGSDIKKIILILRGTACHRQFGFGEKKVMSCSDAIAIALTKYFESKTNEKIKSPILNENLRNDECSECGGTYDHSGGCGVCRDCGYSTCG